MRFKNPGLVAEMARSHPRIQALALYLDQYAKENFGRDLMVTDVERTQAEYDEVYKTPNYAGPRPHLAPQSRAVDFRTVGELTDAQVDQVVMHVNSFWVRQDGKLTAMYHTVKAGAPHLHCQISPI